MIIHSSVAYILAVLSIIGVGVAKTFLTAFPVDCVVAGLVAVTVGYFGKRTIQKHKSMTNETGQTTNLESKYD